MARRPSLSNVAVVLPLARMAIANARETSLDVAEVRPRRPGRCPRPRLAPSRDITLFWILRIIAAVILLSPAPQTLSRRGLTSPNAEGKTEQASYLTMFSPHLALGSGAFTRADRNSNRAPTTFSNSIRECAEAGAALRLQLRLRPLPPARARAAQAGVFPEVPAGDTTGIIFIDWRSLPSHFCHAHRAPPLFSILAGGCRRGTFSRCRESERILFLS